MFTIWFCWLFRERNKIIWRASLHGDQELQSQTITLDNGFPFHWKRGSGGGLSSEGGQRLLAGIVEVRPATSGPETDQSQHLKLVSHIIITVVIEFVGSVVEALTSFEY